MENRAVQSPGSALAATPRVTDSALRESLAEKMGGLAEWDGDRFIFTDPNGSLPATQEDLIRYWKNRMPAAFRDLPGEGLFQKASFIEFIEKNEAFRARGETDMWEDLLRLWSRLRGTKAPARLRRGLSFPDRTTYSNQPNGKKRKKIGINDFLRIVERDGYSVRPDYPVESWSNSETAARIFAKADRNPGKKWSVLLEVDDPSRDSFRDVSALLRALKSDIDLQNAACRDRERVAVGRRFRAAKIHRDKKARTVTIKLQPDGSEN